MADQSVFGEYEAVAAGSTDQVLGNNGSKGDYLKKLIVIPATVAPGAITVKDNNTTIMTTTAGTATVIPSVFEINVDAYSTLGQWKISTGTNVSLLAVGAFT